MSNLFLVGAVAAAVSAGWALLAITLGPELGFVDRPDDNLKTHLRPGVPLGGVGIFLAMVVAAAITDDLRSLTVIPTLIAGAGAVMLGLIDDRRGLSPRVRLVAEAVIGIALAWPDLTGGRLLSGLLVVVATVLAINAVNLYDGLDGLVGATAAVTALVAGVVILPARPIGWPLGAALIGFLVFNWHPARVFLGDNGSYLVGVLLVAIGLRLGPAGSAITPILAIALLGVFLIDLAVTVIRRARAGAELFGGDRSHTYDQLHDGGWSIRRVAATSTAAQTVYVLSVTLALASWGAWAGLGVGLVLGLGGLGWLAAAGFLSAARR